MLQNSKRLYKCNDTDVSLNFFGRPAISNSMKTVAISVLMGTGDVFALGCTIGQGVSAVSVMALSAPLTIIAIVFGARIGLIFLIEGRSAVIDWLKGIFATQSA